MRLPSEEFWLAHSRHSIFRALRTVWDSAFSHPEAYADWLLSVFPDMQDFAKPPVPGEFWQNIRERAAGETALFFSTATVPSDLTEAYNNWVETRILAPLRSDDPWRKDKAINLFKGIIESFDNATR
jgi:hypothetical protein